MDSRYYSLHIGVWRNTHWIYYIVSLTKVHNIQFDDMPMLWLGYIFRLENVGLHCSKFNDFEMSMIRQDSGQTCSIGFIT